MHENEPSFTRHRHGRDRKAPAARGQWVGGNVVGKLCLPITGWGQGFLVAAFLHC
jgi:hypothetical protein